MKSKTIILGVVVLTALVGLLVADPATSYRRFGPFWVHRTTGEPNQLHAKDILHLGHVIDVRDYGAVVDGATNDAAAILSAITAADAAGGGTVAIHGVCAVGSAGWDGIVVASADNVTLLGTGIGSGLKLLNTTTSNYQGILDFTTCHNVTIENLAINMNGVNTNAAPGVVSAIRFNDCNDYTVRNVQAYNSSAATLYSYFVTTALTCQRGKVLNCKSWNLHRHLSFGGTSTTEEEVDLLVQGCWFGNSDWGNGVAFSGHNARISNCVFNEGDQGKALASLYISSGGTYDTKYVTVENCQFRDSGGIHSDAAGARYSQYVTVSNCTFQNISGNAINMTNARNWTVSNCIIVDADFQNSNSSYGLELYNCYDSTISNVIVWDTRATTSRATRGIDFGDGCTGVQIDNARVYNIDGSAIFVQRDMDDSYIRNCRATGSTIGLYVYGEVGDTPANLHVNDNILLGNTTDLRIETTDPGLDWRGNVFTTLTFSGTATYTFTDGDTTPSAGYGHYFVAANTAPTTITDLDDFAHLGRSITIIHTTANTTYDFSGTNLRGNGGIDWTAPTNSVLTVYSSGTVKYCLIESGATWPSATGTVAVSNAASHNYAAGTTAWTMTDAEAAATLFTVTNAGGAADAVFPSAVAGKQFTVYNNSGAAITFKVSGQVGSAVATGKYAIFTTNATECVEIYEQP